MELNTPRLFPHELSDVDKTLVVLLKEGKTYKEIAKNLASTEGDIRTWMRKLRKAFQAKNSVQLVAIVLENGYLKTND